MKKSLSIIFIGISILLFSGCVSKKTTIKPLISDCCLNSHNLLIDKRIFIGNFTLKNEKNLIKIYGKQTIGIDIETITFKESINTIVKEELYRRLSKISNKIKLVDKKPNNFNSKNDIFINGSIDKFWVNQQVPQRGTKFNVKSILYFKIITNVNDEIINNIFNAKLNIFVKDIERSSRIWARLLFNYWVDASETKQRIIHTLHINDNLIADFTYYQFFENAFANFTTDYKVAIEGNIYGKNPQKLNDIAEGNTNKFETFNYLYSYLSPNLNTSPGYNFYGDGTYEKYLSKNEISKIRKNKLIDKQKYNKCILDKEVMNNNECTQANSRNLDNTKYYDIFRLYATTSGILQYMINEHIDNIIEKIK